MKIPMFPGKYHQNGGFSMAMLVSEREESLLTNQYFMESRVGFFSWLN